MAKQSTIYCITNCTNGLQYIGATTNYSARKISHKFLAHKPQRQPLHYAMKEFGFENFKFERLHVCSLNKMAFYEQKYIQQYNTLYPNGYNYTTGGIKGTVYVEETCKKISEAKSGENNPMFGKHLSEETRKKMSKALSGKNHPMFGKKGKENPCFGKHHSEETRKKISEAQKGRHPSEESRKKMSVAQSGENNPMFGKHLSEETRKKMSKALSGKNHPMFGKHHSEETREKMSEAWKGRVVSEETRKKMSEAKKLYYKLKKQREATLLAVSNDVQLTEVETLCHKN